MVRHSDTARSNRLRRFGVVACLAWLNLAMLPCTMAVADAPGCPDCPPAATDAHTAHGMHGGTHDGGHGAHSGAHELPASGPHCGVDQADCCELDDLHVDDRSQKLERDAGPAVSFGLLDNAWQVDREASGSIGHSTGPPRCSTGGVRLHAFHSVYRD